MTTEEARAREVLKPCPNPWCASHDSSYPELFAAHKPIVTASRNNCLVQCPVCPLNGPTRSTSTEAIAAWNTRPTATGGAEAMRDAAARVADVEERSGIGAYRQESTAEMRAYRRGRAEAGQAIALTIRALSAEPASASGEVERLREAMRIIQGAGKTGSWAVLVEPLVARFDVAAKFGGDAVHNTDGSAALAELLREMAGKLDRSSEAARASLQPREREGEA